MWPGGSQVVGPLSALRTLSVFLQDRIKPSERQAQDLVDNMVMQGDRLADVTAQVRFGRIRRPPERLYNCGRDDATGTTCPPPYLV